MSFTQAAFKRIMNERGILFPLIHISRALKGQSRGGNIRHEVEMNSCINYLKSSLHCERASAPYSGRSPRGAPQYARIVKTEIYDIINNPFTYLMFL